MLDKLQLVLSAGVGIVAGAIVALKVIAPKTKTQVDDRVLARLEALEAALEKLLPGGAKPSE